MVHEIYLNEYDATCPGCPSSMRVYFDLYKSDEVEQIKLITNSGWNGLTINAIFSNPNGICASILVAPETLFNVPPEAILYPGYGTIIFIGSKDGVNKISVDISYKVTKSSNDIPPPITPSILEELLEAIPEGGTKGQVLAKRSDEDRDTEWITIEDDNDFPYSIGHGLKIVTETNTLEVDIATDVEEDNTLPISSGAVYMQIGNIESLLETI